MLFVGDDWAEAHHDIEIQDESGRRLVRKRLPEGIAGIGESARLIGRFAGDATNPARWWSGSRPTVGRGCRR